jgi:threonine/homoserine/homoserine lactone efflux protein
MIITLIAGILTGYIVSIPPLGPIAFAMISKGFKNEVKEGLAIGIGAAFMDFVYCMIAFGGISLIISFLPSTAASFYQENISIIQIVLTFTGCFIVVIYGLKIMRSKITFSVLEAAQSEKLSEAFEKAEDLEEKAKEFVKHHKVPVINKVSYSGMFFMGVLLCMSSLTLPASWIALVGYLKGYNIINSSLIGGLLFSAGAMVGTSVWFYTLLKLITGNKHRINPSTVTKLNIVAGVILLLLGIFLFTKATISIFHVI